MAAVSVKWSICFLVCGHKNGFLTLAVEKVFNIQNPSNLCRVASKANFVVHLSWGKTF